MIDTPKLIASAMKNMDKSLEKETTLTVLRELKTKESLLREPLTAEIQYNWLKKMAKEREASFEIYVKAERTDLANKEYFELARIKDLMQYLEKERSVDILRFTDLGLSPPILSEATQSLAASARTLPAADFPYSESKNKVNCSRSFLYAETVWEEYFFSYCI